MPTRGGCHYTQSNDPASYLVDGIPPEDDHGDDLLLSEQEISDHSSPNGPGLSQQEPDDDESSFDSFQGSQAQKEMQAAMDSIYQNDPAPASVTAVDLVPTLPLPPPAPTVHEPYIPPVIVGGNPNLPPPLMTQNTQEAVGALMGLQNTPRISSGQTQQQPFQNPQQAQR
jgi:hypothetical protein